MITGARKFTNAAVLDSEYIPVLPILKLSVVVRELETSDNVAVTLYLMQTAKISAPIIFERKFPPLASTPGAPRTV